jgi:hypothetical protein
LVNLCPGHRYPVSGLLEEGFLAAIRELCPAKEAEIVRLPHTDLTPKSITKIIRRVPGPVGFFGQTREYAETVMKYLVDLGAGVPKDAGLIAVPMVNESEWCEASRVDLLSFDTSELLARAVKLVTGTGTEEVHELIAPIRYRNGSMPARVEA